MLKIATAILILLSANVTAQNILHLASDIWPPFTDVEGEKSIALDIVKNALSRSDVKVEYEIMDFDGVMAGIIQGKKDGSAALWHTEERTSYLLFSDPYLQNQLILVGKKGADVSSRSLSDMVGKSVGAVANYAYTDHNDQAAMPTFVYTQSDQANLEKLLTGMVDYILVDALLIQYLLKYQVNDVSALLEIGTEPMLTKTLHFAIRKDIPNAMAIIADFNRQIDVMKTDGTYHKILGMSWIRADISGDGQYALVLEGTNAGTEEPVQVYDLLYQGNTADAQRYFIDGELYNSWSDVPNNYKQQVAQEQRIDMQHIGYKISLNR